MARESNKTNIRVEVIPQDVRGVIYLSSEQPSEEEKLLRRCRDIAASIKRHVDDVFAAYAIFDWEHVCEHCGSKWSEESHAYNGGCCAEDEAANPDAEIAA